MAGKERILGTDARLGFHAYDFPGLSQDQLKRASDAGKEYCQSRGVNSAFVDKAFGVSSETLWYPTMQELILNGVVTHIDNGSEVIDAESVVLTPGTTLDFNPQSGRLTPGR